jgi:hypothetical protein
MRKQDGSGLRAGQETHRLDPLSLADLARLLVIGTS